MIYFIRAGDKVKIGYARSVGAVRGRYATIRNASPVATTLLGAMDGEPSDEERLHKRLQAFRAEGEWFDAVPEVLDVADRSATVKPVSGTRLSFRCDEELVAAVDTARQREPREAWLRRAVEQALGEGRPVPAADEHAIAPTSGQSLPAPAEQPVEPRRYEREFPTGHVIHRDDVRSSSLVKRDVRPVPKGGKS